MKKVLFVLMACMALCFTGCSDNGEVSSDKIIGDWACSTITEYYLENGRYQTDVEYISIYVSFYPDNTLSYSSEGYRMNGNWVLNGSTLILSFKYGNEEEYEKYTVQKCTSKELLLRMDFDNGYADYNFKKR